MLRIPAVSGFFYPSDPEELKLLLEGLEHSVKDVASCDDPIGVIVPHAGLVYSGITAMHAYKSISASPKRKYIIIGPNHDSFPHYSALYPEGRWVTPLGDVGINGENTQKLITGHEGFVVDANAHAREHSVEVQLPFLQYTRHEDIGMACIVMGDQSEREARAVAKSVYKCLDDSILICSTDLTHYEPEGKARVKDRRLIDAIQKLDIHNFYDILSSERMSTCGFGPTAVMMEVTRMSGGTLRLLDYRTSGDTGGDRNSVVGYSSFLACRP